LGDDNLEIAKSVSHNGSERMIWRLPYHFFKRVVGLKMLQLLSHFLMMVARRWSNNCHVIFSWWFQKDNLAVPKSFSWEGCRIDNLVVTSSFSWEGCQIDDFRTAKLFSWEGR
jgi:hypothetical protein